MRTNGRSNVVLALAFSAFACGGETVTPTGPTPGPTPGSPSLTSISINGPTTLTAGSSVQYNAMARFSDNTTKNVTVESTWSSSAPPFAVVNNTGMVTAVKPGELQINAKFENMSNSLRMTVVPPAGTPWSQLPPISEAAKQYLLEYNINRYGAVTRWNSFPIPVYADPGFRRQDLEDAINFWNTVTGGKVSFQIVSSPASARIVMDFQWPPGNFPVPEEACGVEWPDRIESFVIVSGVAHYAFRAKPECAAPSHRDGLAHGLGHILGLLGHTPGGDVMSSPATAFRTSPLLTELINWLYSVPSGTRPE